MFITTMNHHNNSGDSDIAFALFGSDVMAIIRDDKFKCVRNTGSRTGSIRPGAST